MSEPIKICIQRAATRKEWDEMQADYIRRALLSADRIEKLVAVLRTYACNCGLERDWLCEDRETSSECGYRANKVLEELK